MNERVIDILKQMLCTVTDNVCKKSIEKFIKDSKERIKNELDREIKIDIPFLREATVGEWLWANIHWAFFTWLQGAQFEIQPKAGDRELIELFNTFPIVEWNINE